MGTQAFLDIVSRGELAGVVVLAVIGVALIGLAPAKQVGGDASATALAGGRIARG